MSAATPPDQAPDVMPHIQWPWEQHADAPSGLVVDLGQLLDSPAVAAKPACRGDDDPNADDAVRPPLPLGSDEPRVDVHAPMPETNGSAAASVRAALRAQLDGADDSLCHVLHDFPSRPHGSTLPSAASWNNGPFGPGGKFAHELATCVNVLPLQPPVTRPQFEPFRRAPRGWRRIFVGQCPGQYGLDGVAAVVLMLACPAARNPECQPVKLPSRDPRIERHGILVYDGSKMLFGVEPRVEGSQATAFFVTTSPEAGERLLSCSGHVLCHPDCVTVHSVKYEHRAAVPPTETELHTFLHNVDVWAHADSPSDYVGLGPDERPRRRGFKRAALKPMTFLSSAGPSAPSGPSEPSRRAGAPTAPPGL